MGDGSTSPAWLKKKKIKALVAGGALPRWGNPRRQWLGGERRVRVVWDYHGRRVDSEIRKDGLPSRVTSTLLVVDGETAK